MAAAAPALSRGRAVALLLSAVLTFAVSGPAARYALAHPAVAVGEAGEALQTTPLVVAGGRCLLAALLLFAWVRG